MVRAGRSRPGLRDGARFPWVCAVPSRAHPHRPRAARGGGSLTRASRFHKLGHTRKGRLSCQGHGVRLVQGHGVRLREAGTEVISPHLPSAQGVLEWPLQGAPCHPGEQAGEVCPPSRPSPLGPLEATVPGAGAGSFLSALLAPALCERKPARDDVGRSGLLPAGSPALPAQPALGTWSQWPLAQLGQR